MSLHRSAKPGCKPGISKFLRDSLQSWVQASTYRQMKMTYLWTDTGYQTNDKLTMYGSAPH